VITTARAAIVLPGEHHAVRTRLRATGS